MKAIKQGLTQAYNNNTKLTNYLPINSMRDFMYALIVGPILISYAKQDGSYSRIENQIKSYYIRKDKPNQTPSVKKLMSLLGQYLSSNETLQKELINKMQPLIQNTISKCHYLPLVIIHDYTTFDQYATTSKLTDATWNTLTEMQLMQYKDMLAKNKISWGGEFRKAIKSVYDSIPNQTPESAQKYILSYEAQAKSHYPQVQDYSTSFEQTISVQGPTEWADNGVQPNTAAYYWNPPDQKYKDYGYNSNLTQKSYNDYLAAYNSSANNYRQAVAANQGQYDQYRLPASNYNYDTLNFK